MIVQMKIQHLDVTFQCILIVKFFIIDGRRMVLCIQVSDVTRQKVEKIPKGITHMTDLKRIRKMHLRHFSCNQDDREYMGESGFLQRIYNSSFND